MDHELSFHDHVKTFKTFKVTAKLNLSVWIIQYVDLPKKKFLINSLLGAQFKYYPLTWLIHSCDKYRKIYYLHKTIFIWFTLTKGSEYFSSVLKQETPLKSFIEFIK